MTELEAKMIVLHNLTGGPVVIDHEISLTGPDSWVVAAGLDEFRAQRTAHALERAVDELVDKLGGRAAVAPILRAADNRERAMANAAMAHAAGRKVK